MLGTLVSSATQGVTQPPVFQIFLSSQRSTTLPPALFTLSSTIRQWAGDYYRLYDADALRQFLSENYGKEIIHAYDALQPYAYKADLGRYALLLHYGGWYFDIGTRLHNPVGLQSEIELGVFREQLLAGNCSWACQNAVLYAKPGHRVFQRALERIIWNARHHYYGANTLCPTGPILFGKALAASELDINKIITGESIRLTPIHANKNMAFVLPDGTIMAFHKPAQSGDLTTLGAQGTNNDVDLWQQRKVYLP